MSGFTNMFATEISEAAASYWGQGVRSNAGLLRVVDKKIVPKGTSTVEVIIPGAITGTTRTAGSSYTPAEPTDTSVSLTPSTEYAGTPVPLDRLNLTRSAIDLATEYAPQCVGSAIDTLSTALWALSASITTNTAVGTTGTTPAVADLAICQTRLFDAKVNKDLPWYAVIGGAEQEAWTPSLTYNNYGPAGQSALQEGVMGQMYGFNVVADQSRTSNGDADKINLALHPKAITCAFRSEIDDRAAFASGSYVDSVSGITVFTVFKALNSSGEGAVMQIFVVASVAIVKNNYAVQLLG